MRYGHQAIKTETKARLESRQRPACRSRAGKRDMKILERKEIRIICRALVCECVRWCASVCAGVRVCAMGCRQSERPWRARYLLLRKQGRYLLLRKEGRMASSLCAFTTRYLLLRKQGRYCRKKTVASLNRPPLEPQSRGRGGGRLCYNGNHNSMQQKLTN
jgi:hypothetical protein